MLNQYLINLVPLKACIVKEYYNYGNTAEFGGNFVGKHYYIQPKHSVHLDDISYLL